MTLQKRYSAPIIAGIIVITLAIGLSLQDSTAQISQEELEFDYRNSAINGMQLRTTFHFEGIGDNTLETFSVYRQLSGFKKDDVAAPTGIGARPVIKRRCQGNVSITFPAAGPRLQTTLLIDLPCAPPAR